MESDSNVEAMLLKAQLDFALADVKYLEQSRDYWRILYEQERAQNATRA